MADIENNDSNNIKSVLITGGSGFVGRHLSELLLAKGYNVSVLSGKKKLQSTIHVYQWNPGEGTIDADALNGIDCIVHLAGANLGEKRWTGKRKEEIIRSRVNSAQILFDTVAEKKLKLKAFVSASAIGYYGAITTDRIFTEDDDAATDFLGHTCKTWEAAADLFAGAGVRTVKIRTALVLDKEGGALTKLYNPAQYGFVIRTGSGKQYMPWIHISDLCHIYLKAIEDNMMAGPYNAVSPQHINHYDFVRRMAYIMKRPVFLPPVPSFVLQLVLGEMSDLILKGSRVSSKKISAAGYSFLFPNLDEALKDLLV